MSLDHSDYIQMMLADFGSPGWDVWSRQQKYSWDYYNGEILDDKNGELAINVSRVPQVVNGFVGMVLGSKLESEAYTRKREYVKLSKKVTNVLQDYFFEQNFPQNADTSLIRMTVGGVGILNVEPDFTDWDEEWQNGKVKIWHVDPRLNAYDCSAQHIQDIKRQTVRYLLRKEYIEDRFGTGSWYGSTLGTDQNKPDSLPNVGSFAYQNGQLYEVFRTVYCVENYEDTVIPTYEDAVAIYEYSMQMGKPVWLQPDTAVAVPRGYKTYPFQGKRCKRIVKKWKSVWFNRNDTLEDEVDTATGKNPYVNWQSNPMDGTAYAKGMFHRIQNEALATSLYATISTQMAALGKAYKKIVNANYFNSPEQAQMFCDALVDEDYKGIPIAPRDPLTGNNFNGDLRTILFDSEPPKIDPSIVELMQVLLEIQSNDTGMKDVLLGSSPASDPANKVALLQQSANNQLQPFMNRVEQGFDDLYTAAYDCLQVVLPDNLEVRRQNTKSASFDMINYNVTEQELQLFGATGQLTEDDTVVPKGDGTYIVNPFQGNYRFTIRIDQTTPGEKARIADRAVNLLLPAGLITRETAAKLQPEIEDPVGELQEVQQEQMEAQQNALAMQAQMGMAAQPPEGKDNAGSGEPKSVGNSNS